MERDNKTPTLEVPGFTRPQSRTKTNQESQRSQLPIKRLSQGASSIYNQGIPNLLGSAANGINNGIDAIGSKLGQFANNIGQGASNIAGLALPRAPSAIPTAAAAVPPPPVAPPVPTAPQFLQQPATGVVGQQPSLAEQISAQAGQSFQLAESQPELEALAAEFAAAQANGTLPAPAAPKPIAKPAARKDGLTANGNNPSGVTLISGNFNGTGNAGAGGGFNVSQARENADGILVSGAPGLSNQEVAQQDAARKASIAAEQRAQDNKVQIENIKLEGKGTKAAGGVLGYDDFAATAIDTAARNQEPEPSLEQIAKGFEAYKKGKQ